MGHIREPHEQPNSFFYKEGLTLTTNAISDRDVVIAKFITQSFLRSSHSVDNASKSKCISVTELCEVTEVFDSFTGFIKNGL